MVFSLLTRSPTQVTENLNYPHLSSSSPRRTVGKPSWNQQHQFPLELKCPVPTGKLGCVESERGPQYPPSRVRRSIGNL